MRWSEERDPSTNHLLYQLANFTSKEESEEQGFTVTHAGHCGACSSLQDLGVYIRQNLTVVINTTDISFTQELRRYALTRLIPYWSSYQG